MKLWFKPFLGECLGTFILVFVGCGSIACSVLFDTFSNLIEIALVWTFGVTLGIYCSKKLSAAHLNPAVTLAMIVAKRLIKNHGLGYLTGQFTGAFIAAATLYLIMPITDFEFSKGIVRGCEESVLTASIFGEFFPNPGYADTIGPISQWIAFSVEMVGTTLLVFVIFKIDNFKKLSPVAPLLIGITVGILICFLAPISQAGFNPARDLAPRIFAYLAGWGNAAFPSPNLSFLVVYVMGPLIGGIFGYGLYKGSEKELA